MCKSGFAVPSQKPQGGAMLPERFDTAEPVVDLIMVQYNYCWLCFIMFVRERTHQTEGNVVGKDRASSQALATNN